MTKDKQIEEMAYDICVSRKANYADGCRVCSHHESRCLYQDIACSLYTAGYRKQSEWISVEERLPESSDTILYFDGGWVDACCFVGGHFETLDAYESDIIYGVTHWMPLPEAPKMKGGVE